LTPAFQSGKPLMEKLLDDARFLTFASNKKGLHDPRLTNLRFT
jgi:hypothetical protein